MQDQIQREINGFYARYAAKEGLSVAEARKRVAEADIEAYGRKAKKYVANKTLTDEANEEMRLYNATMKINRLEMLKANIGLELVDGFDGLQKLFGQKLTKRTLAEFKRQAGILGKTVQDNEKAAHSIVNASFNNARYSDRIWMYQDMLKSELDQLLRTGLIQGRNPRVLARHLEKLFGVSRNNAERLMQTELCRVQTEAQKQSYERNGYDRYVFIAEPTACPICRELDDKDFEVNKMMPGENASPMHPHCRCSTAAYMDRAEFDQWLDHLNKGGTTEQWNKSKKPVEKSDKSDKMEMYRKGNPHRKRSSDGSSIIDKATYNKITKPAIKNGADIRIADAEYAEHLRKQNATASTIGDIIMFSPEATVSDVLEEVYHFDQNRKKVNNKYDEVRRTILNEIEAKEYLLSVRDKYHIPQKEDELTRKQLESYKKQMEDMKKRGEWND